MIRQEYLYAGIAGLGGLIIGYFIATNKKANTVSRRSEENRMQQAPPRVASPTVVMKPYINPSIRAHATSNRTSKVYGNY